MQRSKLFNPTTRSAGSAGSTKWSATKSTVTMTVKKRKQPPVDSITHTKFQTPNRTKVEKKQMRQIQIQDRGTHNYKQTTDPDLQMDLQQNLLDLHPNLQEDPPTDLQADLQWICKLIFKSGLIYSQICESTDKDLKVPYNKTLFWCHFRLRLQLRERRSGWGATLHSCYQIIVHLWEELVSEWILPGSRRLSQGPKHVIGELSIKPGHAYRILQVYKDLQESTRLTTSQIHPRSWPKVSKLWRVSNAKGTVFNTLPQMFATISRQCSYTQSTQPCQWAVQLHHHSMKREQHLWGRTLLTVPKVWLILQFQQLHQDQHNIQAVSNKLWHCNTVSNNVCHCLTHWDTVEGLLWSVQWWKCEVIISFQTINCVRIFTMDTSQWILIWCSV